MLIDFLPARQLRGLRGDAVSEQRVLAIAPDILPALGNLPAVLLALGREGPARAALQSAIDNSESAPQRQRYAAKLAQLRAMSAR